MSHMIRNTKRSSPVGPPFVSLVVLVTAALLALIQSLQVQCTDVILCDFIKNYDPSKLDHLNRNEKEDRLEDIKRTLEKMIPNMCAELGSYTNKDGRSCFDFKGIPTSTCNADNEKGKDKSKVVGLCKNTVKCKANETINLDNIILAFHRTIVQEYRTIAIETSSEVVKTLNPPLKYALGYHCEGIKGLYELKEKLNATDIGTLKKKLKKKDLQSQYFKTLKSLKNFTRYFKYYFWGSGANLQCDKTEDKDERYSKAYISGFAAKQSYFRLDTKKQGTIGKLFSKAFHPIAAAAKTTFFGDPVDVEVDEDHENSTIKQFLKLGLMMLGLEEYFDKLLDQDLESYLSQDTQGDGKKSSDEIKQEEGGGKKPVAFNSIQEGKDGASAHSNKGEEGKKNASADSKKTGKAGGDSAPSKNGKKG